jgi:hypothetical protein
MHESVTAIFTHLIRRRLAVILAALFIAASTAGCIAPSLKHFKWWGNASSCGETCECGDVSACGEACECDAAGECTGACECDVANECCPACECETCDESCQVSGHFHRLPFCKCGKAMGHAGCKKCGCLWPSCTPTGTVGPIEPPGPPRFQPVPTAPVYAREFGPSH